MNCPNCKADNVQTVKMAYLSGSSSGTAHSHTKGVAWGGSVGFFGAKTTTTSSSQTGLARTISPPIKYKTIWLGIVFALLSLYSLSGLVQVVANRSPSAFGIEIVTIALTVLAGFYFFKRLNWNNKHYPQLAEQWNAAWICHKCGTTWIPSGNE